MGKRKGLLEVGAGERGKGRGLAGPGPFPLSPTLVKAFLYVRIRDSF